MDLPGPDFVTLLCGHRLTDFERGANLKKDGRKPLGVM